MSTLLEAKPRSLSTRIGTTLAYWSPLVLALALFAQVSLLGLRPAMAERARLEHEAHAVRARYTRTRDAFEHTRESALAWDDPVYRERMRRVRAAAAGTNPGSAPAASVPPGP